MTQFITWGGLMVIFAMVLWLIWGVIWAMILQFSRVGQWLVRERTWLTVVIGVGVDLLIALLVVPLGHWWVIALGIALSAVGIVYRSIYNEAHHNATEMLAEAEQVANRTRIANKTMWALNDILMSTTEARRATETIHANAKKVDELAPLLVLVRAVADIERTARNALEGRYEQ